MVDRLVFEDRGYILARSEEPGGRGLNASRVIHSFGGKTFAVLTAGGEEGERLSTMVTLLGFRTDIVKIRNRSRANLTISDKQGLTVKLNELGPEINTDELKLVYKAVENAIKKASWLMLCGSIPPGVPAHFYNELIELARSQNVNTLLDTDGDALTHGLEAKPTVVTPNQLEAERLLGKVLITRSQCMEAVDRIQVLGAEAVILSLGSRGAIGKSGEEMWEALPPRVDALTPIGAGDAMAAAFVWAMEKKKSFAESLRWGVAAGTASAKLPGIQFASLQQSREIYRNVEIRPAR